MLSWLIQPEELWRQDERKKTQTARLRFALCILPCQIQFPAPQYKDFLQLMMDATVDELEGSGKMKLTDDR